MKKSGTILVNPPKKFEPKTKETEKLDELVKESSEILYEVSAVFPFQLFPDKVIINTTKVTVVHKGLFFKHIFPILIRDLNTVKVSRGILFASLSFEIKSFEENPEPVSFLWPDQAGKAESIILGLLSAVRAEGVDVSKVPLKKVKKSAEKIGASTEKPENLF